MTNDLKSLNWTCHKRQSISWMKENFDASDAIYQNHAFEFVPHRLKVRFRYFDSLTNDLIIAIEWERLPTIYHRYVARKKILNLNFRTSWFTRWTYSNKKKLSSTIANNQRFSYLLSQFTKKNFIFQLFFFLAEHTKMLLTFK